MSKVFIKEAASVIDAIRKALKAPEQDSHIIHYWWSGKTCFVCFAFGHKLYFLNVAEPETGTFAVEVERITERA